MVERLGGNVIFLPQNARSSLVLLYVATGSDFKSIDTPNVNQESNSFVLYLGIILFEQPKVFVARQANWRFLKGTNFAFYVRDKYKFYLGL